jgi:hypothetical protein
MIGVIIIRTKNLDRNILLLLTIINLILLKPIFARKPPIKDLVLVFLFNAVTNVVIDNILSRYKILEYPHRILSKSFNINLLFDLLIYPNITVLYNQITFKNKPFAIFYKLFYFTIPMFLIELWAERKTNLIDWRRNLITWRRKWKWYYTFLSITCKSLLTRLFIGWVRKIDERQKILQ